MRELIDERMKRGETIERREGENGENKRPE